MYLIYNSWLTWTFKMYSYSEIIFTIHCKCPHQRPTSWSLKCDISWKANITCSHETGTFSLETESLYLCWFVPNNHSFLTQYLLLQSKHVFTEINCKTNDTGYLKRLTWISECILNVMESTANWKKKRRRTLLTGNKQRQERITETARINIESIRELPSEIILYTKLMPNLYKYLCSRCCLTIFSQNQVCYSIHILMNPLST